MIREALNVNGLTRGAGIRNFLAPGCGRVHKAHMIARLYTVRFIAILLGLTMPLISLAAKNPFVGAWELKMPGGGAGWLGVQEAGGRLEASLLWIAGSVQPTASAKVEDGKLVLTRNYTVERKDASGKTEKKTYTETIIGSVAGDKIELSSSKPRADGTGEEKVEIGGKRSPPMPPAPDLSKEKFGKEIQLFNGKDLSGWRLTDPNAPNGWSAKDGILVNNAPQEEGKPHKNYGNLRTEREFEDFNLKLEIRLPKNGNSGVYLRGIYEVQMADSYGQPPSANNMGSIYSRIKPGVNASKPAGEWQTADATLVDRHVTVILNGAKIIDNQPVPGCTGGALWSDVSRPGPIYFQGDHTSVEYRNIVLRPVVKQ
jgi:hypothetical protein